MTCRALYLLARRTLQAAGVDSPGFDAAALSEKFLGLDRPGLAVHGEQEAGPQEEAAFLEALAQRERRRPLQYILGEWPFMGLALSVGEGVLAPREDTAVLAESVAARLAGGATRGLDLCSGSGAVALGICSLRSGAEIACVELDPGALGYLRENLARYPDYPLSVLAADVLTGPPEDLAGGLDFIAANPPYVRSGEIPELQPEVLLEPRLALDGGGDGLAFYRAIAGKWVPLLRPGGLLGVEIGESQGEEVREIFEKCGLREIEVIQDLAGLDRVVVAKKSEATDAVQGR